MAIGSFVWNDETKVNSYGFRVLNGGGDFARFDQNPAMQGDHVNTTEANLGNWKNRRIEGFLLKGDPVFDTDRDTVKEVEGQVDRGFIKGCSMGLLISWDEGSWQKAPDGVWELVKWELMEVSICAIPSLGSALALYDKATGNLIAEDQIKLSVQKLSAEKINFNNPDMEKIKLTLDATAFLLSQNISNADTEAGISNAFIALKGKLEAAEGQLKTLKEESEKQIKLQAEALIDGAIADEKIVKGDREEWLSFAVSNLALATKQVSKLPGKISLNNKLKNAGGDNDAEVKTKEDFSKLTPQAALAWKNENPDAYKKLFAK